MNADALQPLRQRWPADSINVTQSNSAYIFTQLGRSAEQPNVYQDYLHIDTVDSKAINDFALANNMAYSTQGTDLSLVGKENVPGWLGPHRNPDKPMFTHRTSGIHHGFPIEIQLSYSVASIQTENSSQVNLSRKSIIEITLPKVFPQIVLDSNRNEPTGLRTYPTSFNSDQKHDLEGNFSKYFDFYAPIGIQANTLTVLAPNFMQMLIDASLLFDVEFYGSKLYFIMNGCIYDPAVLQSSFRAIDIQLQYMDRLLSSWEYEPKQLPFDMLQTAYWQGPVTKIGPWRLSAGQTVAAILAGFALVALIILIL